MSSSRIPDEGGSQGKDLVTNKDKPPHKADKSALPTTGDDSTSGIAPATLVLTDATPPGTTRKARTR